MTVLYVALVPLTLCLLAISINLINYGLFLCDKNNVFGILFLTISLNIIGTFIGCMIIYKKQNPEFKFWNSFRNKFKKMFKFTRIKKIAQ
ncbi:hypothetical protein [Spiroplasma endosymbiont of Virgichneumon dumeticola]|uniref:hypothetical protein n=1 Tax=Spiroplasma endosymbiont of Virgichneumon dumeticola TaxID=3139323 RepID=UPI0035C8D80E